MKLLNNVLLSVFVKGGEDEAKIAEKLKSFVPLDFEKEKLQIKRINAEGFNEKIIIILELELKREKHTNEFVETMKKLAPEQKELLLRQAESRLDTEYAFFIRFDKDKLLNEDEYWITDSGNCFHVKMNLACFPKKREKAMEILQNIFK
jgi:RNA binding exosome subunit